eukprot:162981_1
MIEFSLDITYFDSTSSLLFEVTPFHTINASIHQDIGSDFEGDFEDRYETLIEGYHDLLLTFYNKKDDSSIKIIKHGSVSGTIKIHNEYGCLNGNEFPKKSLLGVLSVMVFVSTIVYFISLQRNGDYVIKHHVALLTLAILGTSEFMIHYFSVQYTNNYCIDSNILQFITILLKTFRDIAFMIMSIALFDGWGIKFALISIQWRKAYIKLALLMFIPSFLTSYAIITSIDMEESFSFMVRVGVIFRIILQIILSLYMMNALSKLKNHIKSRDVRQQKKYDNLVIFERVLILMQCIGFIYTFHMWWSYVDNVDIHWRYEWIEIYGIWDVLFSALLISMLFMWSSSAYHNINGQNGHVLKISDISSPRLRRHNNNINIGIGSDIEIEELLKSATDLESNDDEFDMNELEDELEDERVEFSYYTQNI